MKRGTSKNALSPGSFVPGLGKGQGNRQRFRLNRKKTSSINRTVTGMATSSRENKLRRIQLLIRGSSVQIKAVTSKPLGDLASSTAAELSHRVPENQLNLSFEKSAQTRM